MLQRRNLDPHSGASFAANGPQGQSSRSAVPALGAKRFTVYIQHSRNDKRFQNSWVFTGDNPGPVFDAHLLEPFIEERALRRIRMTDDLRAIACRNCQSRTKISQPSSAPSER